MNILHCQACGNKTSYSEKEKAYLCDNCGKYVGTMVRCPSCKLSIRVATRTRPYSFNCPVCEMELTLDRENRLWSALNKRKTEEEALPLTCGGCGNGVEAHWWFCPFCAVALKELSEYEAKSSCLNCTLPIEPEWSFCAFCSSPQAEKDEGRVITEATEKEAVMPALSEEELILPPDDRVGEGLGESGGEFLSAQKRTEEVDAEEGGSEAFEEKKKDVCPGCGKNIEPDWLVCRYCMSKLKKRDEKMNCPSCGKTIKPGRMICPFCSTDLARHESKEEEEVFGYSEHVPSSFSGQEPGEELEEKTYYEEYDGGAGEEKYEEGVPLCPICDTSTQYSEEERDCYCWACKKYISEMG